jgi:hypothetical protein
MGQYTKTNIFSAHDNACNSAEAVRQVAVAAAAQSPAGQVTINNAEIVWARAAVASCIANNNGAGQGAFRDLLRALGTGGN